MTKTLLLTGFMGTGKTTVGRVLAARFGLPFLDLDEEIERRTGRTVTELFSEGGEETFRRVEREALAAVLAAGGVIATGGGCLVPAANREMLGGDECVVCLTADPEEVERRLRVDTSRPLLTDRSAIRRLLDERRGAYALFPQVSTTGRTVDEVVDDVAALVQASCIGELSFTRCDRSEVLFEAGGLSRSGASIRARVGGRNALLVTDRTVASLGYADTVSRSLSEQGVDVHGVTLPEGEEQKSLQSLGALWEAARAAGLQRGDAVVAVGGGVICDLAGMAAATYMRGVSLVLIPTTLLAQVDAAIGGKVGIDVGGVKNLAGAFHPAGLVLVDSAVLASLPAARISEGLAEGVKIAAMRSRQLWDDLAALPTPSALLDRPDLIRRMIGEKLAVVRDDPYERNIRALLNFGHTVGHGLEAASGYRVAHGSAVAAGMVAETKMARDLGLCDDDVVDAVGKTLERLDLPTALPGLGAHQVWAAMGNDKKRAGSAHRFALPRSLGRGEVIEVDARHAERAVHYALEDAA